MSVDAGRVVAIGTGVVNRTFPTTRTAMLRCAMRPVEPALRSSAENRKGPITTAQETREKGQVAQTEQPESIGSVLILLAADAANLIRKP